MIEKHTPIDGDYYLIDGVDGKLFAKTWTEQDALLVDSVHDLRHASMLLSKELHAMKKYHNNLRIECEIVLRSLDMAIAKGER